jgi:hypothetical protein
MYIVNLKVLNEMYSKTVENLDVTFAGNLMMKKENFMSMLTNVEMMSFEDSLIVVFQMIQKGELVEHRISKGGKLMVFYSRKSSRRESVEIEIFKKKLNFMIEVLNEKVKGLEKSVLGIEGDVAKLVEVKKKLGLGTNKKVKRQSVDDRMKLLVKKILSLKKQKKGLLNKVTFLEIAREDIEVKQLNEDFADCLGKINELKEVSKKKLKIE